VRLAARSIIVTGGSRGIGAALVRKFVSEGARVAFSYFSNSQLASDLERQIRSLGGEAFAMAADVGDRAAVDALVAETLRRHGRIDVVVNNAHQAYEAKWFEEASWSDFQRELDTLMRGPFNLIQACLPAMKAAGGGTIVNIGSTMAQTPRPRHSFYIAAKCGLMGLTQALALELGRYGIRVNMVTPGPLDTAHNAAYPPELMRRLGEETPLHGRQATLDEVADAIAMMALHEARVITGANVLASGGFSIA
jgi:3-oxoacyl-[acyl-carrier protein] reductase